MSFTTGKTLRVALRAVHTADGDEQVNTFHYDLHDEGVEPNDPQSLADFFRDNVIAHFAILYNSAWTIEPVVVTEEKDPLNPTAPRAQWTSGDPLAGTRVVSGDVLARGLCMVAAIRSDKIGKRARGRCFVGGTVGEGDVNGDTFSSDALNLAQTYLNAVPKQPDIAGPSSTSQANWSVYSRTSRAENLPDYLFHVQSVLVSPKVRYLRRREP